MSYIDKTELYLTIAGGTVVNLSLDQMDEITLKRGFANSSIWTRTAAPGLLTFMLNNSASNQWGIANTYTPRHANCLTGFKKGAKISLDIYYDNKAFRKFEGWIVDIKVDYYDQVSSVTVGDWMYLANQNPCPTMTYDYPSDVFSKITKVMPTFTPTIDVYGKSSGSGFQLFNGMGNGFDTTKPISLWIDRTMINEGYAYVGWPENNYSGSPKLIVESLHYRDIDRSGSSIPKIESDSSPISTQSGSFLFTQSGSPLYYDEAYDMTINNTAEYIDYGESTELYNKVYVTFLNTNFHQTYTSASSIAEYGLFYKPVRAWLYTSISPGVDNVFNTILNLYDEPRTIVNYLEFTANCSHELMALALYGDVGYPVRIIEDKFDLDELYYIDFIELKILGSQLKVKWKVRENLVYAF